MIYPPSFPLDIDNEGERKVYHILKTLDREKYDIFYDRKFSKIESGERSEYQADFIIADIDGGKLNAVLVIEVKGGRIKFNGVTNEWRQNDHHLGDPVSQASSISNSLVKRYPEISKSVPFGWALCFPDMIAPDLETTPDSVKGRLIDSLFLGLIEKQLPVLLKYIRNCEPYRNGLELSGYIHFKESLLRGLGYVLPLHKQIALAEQKFIRLTEEQMQLLRIVKANQNIFVTGPAGSGKTVMATTLAREEYENGQKVLLLTFNRILANNIRYGLQLPQGEQRLDVMTYHGLAKRKIEAIEASWWSENSRSEDFWSLGAAIKLDEILKKSAPEYDLIIIDEGQDFYELWFDSLDKLLKPEGSFFVFMDEHQNIFNAFTKIPGTRQFFKFPLPHNCRNTKNIISYLEKVVNGKIPSKSDSPEGEPVKIVEFKNDVEQMNLIKSEWLRLVDEEKISPDRIVIIFNALKKNSCIGSTRKFGKYPIETIDHRTGVPSVKVVNYATINTFKGLESDIVFIIDTDKVENPNYKILYTQASRARYLLYVFIKSEK